MNTLAERRCTSDTSDADGESFLGRGAKIGISVSTDECNSAVVDLVACRLTGVERARHLEAGVTNNAQHRRAAKQRVCFESLDPALSGRRREVLEQERTEAAARNGGGAELHRRRAATDDGSRCRSVGSSFARTIALVPRTEQEVVHATAWLDQP
jgi:hypothetical protein